MFASDFSKLFCVSESTLDIQVGISPSDLPHIFERLYRADESRSRESGGTGLGLSIAKWIAEAHKGKISVVSKVGEGSVFRVQIPLSQETGPSRTV